MDMLKKLFPHAFASTEQNKFVTALIIYIVVAVVGALVGWLTSVLYMPLIQMAYAAYDNALPLRLISEQSDMTRLLIIVGAVMMVCMLILGWLISRMKIAQALKLGED